MANHWQARALCKGMGWDAFFLGPGKSPSKAKAICQKCPVRQDCLKESIVYGERGIWAGMTEEERDLIAPDLQEPWREQMLLEGRLKVYAVPIARSVSLVDSTQDGNVQELLLESYSWMNEDLDLDVTS